MTKLPVPPVNDVTAHTLPSGEAADIMKVLFADDVYSIDCMQTTKGHASTIIKNSTTEIEHLRRQIKTAENNIEKQRSYIRQCDAAIAKIQEKHRKIEHFFNNLFPVIVESQKVKL